MLRLTEAELLGRYARATRIMMALSFRADGSRATNPSLGLSIMIIVPAGPARPGEA